MTYPNGRFPADALVKVDHDNWLSIPTANALKALVEAGKAQGIKITLPGLGSGYRDLKVQEEMQEGSLGNKALAEKYDLNPNSQIHLASPGYSSHGKGTRVDLLFNGSSWPSIPQLRLAADFGFTREFGSDDPNHFQHDGKTHIQYRSGPVSRRSTNVASGDTLTAIATRNHLSLPKLLSLNAQITDPDHIAVGQRIWLS